MPIWKFIPLLEHAKGVHGERYEPIERQPPHGGVKLSGIQMSFDTQTEVKRLLAGLELITFLRTVAQRATGWHWDCIDHVETDRIRINTQDHQAMCQAVLDYNAKHRPDVGPDAISLFLINYMPGADDFIPSGTVWVLEGAFREEVSDGDV